MKSVLIISPKKDEVRLIRESLPSDYQVKNADSFKNALKLHRQCSFDVIFSDLKLLRDTSETNNIAEAIKPFKEMNPLAELLILSSKAFIHDTVKAVKAGAKGYLTYPIDPSEVRLVMESVYESLTKNLELDYLRDQFWKPEWLDIIDSRNAEMREVFKKIRSVASTRATVLLIGETGTGKGLLARMIHIHSNRCDDPFISVHCGAIPDTLLESELFGHEKALLQVLCAKNSVNLKWPVAALSFWTKSARLRPRPRSSYCRCCKMVPSAGSVVKRRCKPTPG